MGKTADRQLREARILIAAKLRRASDAIQQAHTRLVIDGPSEALELEIVRALSELDCAEKYNNEWRRE